MDLSGKAACGKVAKRMSLRNHHESLGDVKIGDPEQAKMGSPNKGNLNRQRRKGLGNLSPVKFMQHLITQLPNLLDSTCDSNTGVN